MIIIISALDLQLRYDLRESRVVAPRTVIGQQLLPPTAIPSITSVAPSVIPPAARFGSIAFAVFLLIPLVFPPFGPNPSFLVRFIPRPMNDVRSAP